MNLQAPIVPNTGLGGLLLRSRVADMQELILETASAPNAFQLVTPFEAIYTVAGHIEVGVDVRNGKMFRLTAKAGYAGTLFGGIRVGMQVKKAMALEPRLYYNEAEGLIECRGVEGLSIDVPEPDPLPAAVPNLAISAITVYAKEAMTAQGQKGIW